MGCWNRLVEAGCLQSKKSFILRTGVWRQAESVLLPGCLRKDPCLAAPLDDRSRCSALGSASATPQHPAENRWEPRQEGDEHAQPIACWVRHEEHDHHRQQDHQRQTTSQGDAASRLLGGWRRNGDSRGLPRLHGTGDDPAPPDDDGRCPGDHHSQSRKQQEYPQMEQEVIERKQPDEERHDPSYYQQYGDHQEADLKPLFSCGGGDGGPPQKDEDGLEMERYFVSVHALAPSLRWGCSSLPPSIQRNTPVVGRSPLAHTRLTSALLPGVLDRSNQMMRACQQERGASHSLLA